MRRPPRSPLFPHTPLFRSGRPHAEVGADARELPVQVLPLPHPQVVQELRLAESPEPAGRQRFLAFLRSEEHTSELQSRQYLVCRLLLEKKKKSKPPFTLIP